MAETARGPTVCGEDGRNSEDNDVDTSSNYDDIVDVTAGVTADSVYDVIEDESNEPAAECHQRGLYDDLQPSTRDFISDPQSQLYQQILPDAATSAAVSDGISQDEMRVYLQIVSDDCHEQAPKETTRTFHHKVVHKFATVSFDTATRANTM